MELLQSILFCGSYFVDVAPYPPMPSLVHCYQLRILFVEVTQRLVCTSDMSIHSGVHVTVAGQRAHPRLDKECETGLPMGKWSRRLGLFTFPVPKL